MPTEKQHLSTTESLPALSNNELILKLRKAANIWFKNTDLLLLEELIRRYNRALPISSPIE